MTNIEKIATVANTGYAPNSLEMLEKGVPNEPMIQVEYPGLYKVSGLYTGQFCKLSPQQAAPLARKLGIDLPSHGCEVRVPDGRSVWLVHCNRGYEYRIYGERAHTAVGPPMGHSHVSKIATR